MADNKKTNKSSVNGDAAAAAAAKQSPAKSVADKTDDVETRSKAKESKKRGRTIPSKALEGYEAWKEEFSSHPTLIRSGWVLYSKHMMTSGKKMPEISKEWKALKDKERAQWDGEKLAAAKAKYVKDVEAWEAQVGPEAVAAYDAWQTGRANAPKKPRKKSASAKTSSANGKQSDDSGGGSDAPSDDAEAKDAAAEDEEEGKEEEDSGARPAKRTKTDGMYDSGDAIQAMLWRLSQDSFARDFPGVFVAIGRVYGALACSKFRAIDLTTMSSQDAIASFFRAALADADMKRALDESSQKRLTNLVKKYTTPMTSAAVNNAGKQYCKKTYVEDAVTNDSGGGDDNEAAAASKTKNTREADEPKSKARAPPTRPPQSPPPPRDRRPPAKSPGDSGSKTHTPSTTAVNVKGPRRPRYTVQADS